MGLKELLEPEIIGGILIGTGLLWYVDSLRYNFFKDKLSFSREDFAYAQFLQDYFNQNKFSESAREGAIKLYGSFVNKKVPKLFLFSRPFFYFRAKKELSDLQEESEKRLEELKVT